MNQLVTVIIPVYNVNEYIAGCLDSVLGQTHKNLEVIVVNDGSTDGSAETCDRYAASDSRIRVLHQDNQGVSAARNRALDRANGEYVLFVDGDDIASPALVATLLRAAYESGLDLVACRYSRFGTAIDFHKPKEIGSTIQSAERALEEMFAGKRIDSGPFCKLIKGSIIAKIRFDEDVPVGEDLDFFSRILLGPIQEIAFVDEALYGYRERHNSAMNGTFRKQYVDYLELAMSLGEKVSSRYPSAKDAVAYRIFGIASYCVGMIVHSGRDYNKELGQCSAILAIYAPRVLVYSKSTAKNRLIALAYTVSPKLASRLRQSLQKRL